MPLPTRPQRHCNPASLVSHYSFFVSILLSLFLCLITIPVFLSIPFRCLSFYVVSSHYKLFYILTFYLLVLTWVYITQEKPPTSTRLRLFNRCQAKFTRVSQSRELATYFLAHVTSRPWTCSSWMLHMGKIGSIPSSRLRNMEEQKSWSVFLF